MNSVESMAMADRGDETQRRFKYQINYTALKALQLLRDNADFVAIYCEHVEDLLIEHTDGLLTGIQVKSRELDQSQLKASDEAVIGTLKRFCIRDRTFPNKFKSFIFATNFVFHSSTGAESLSVILGFCRDGSLPEKVKKERVEKYIDRIAKEISCTREQVISTMAKVCLEERRTGIDQPDVELMPALGSFENFRQCQYLQLLHLSKTLQAHIWDISSPSLRSMVLDSHKVTNDLQLHLDGLRAARKRLDRREMDQLLQLDEQQNELLRISGYQTREAIPPGLGRMELKMGDGEITYADVEEMKDNVATLEATFLKWKEKYGLKEANSRLAHFQALTMRQARQAEAEAAALGRPYGARMLSDLRQRLEQTLVSEGKDAFGCRPEHLVGTAGLLSEECKIWWAENRSLFGLGTE
ncbi:MAG: dsDNA nuclease domain-containing protein [Allorhizobium sp.]